MITVKQAGAELYQAQFKLGLVMLAGLSSIFSFAGDSLLWLKHQQVGAAAIYEP